jgi:hypothetical protein
MRLAQSGAPRLPVVWLAPADASPAAPEAAPPLAAKLSFRFEAMLEAIAPGPLAAAEAPALETPAIPAAAALAPVSPDAAAAVR